MKRFYKVFYPALALTAIAFLMITACQKLDFSAVTKSTIEEVNILSADKVEVAVDIFDLSEGAHPDYGVCYSETEALPTITGNKVSKGALTGTKKETIPITGLQPGSKIYIRAYVMNGNIPQYSFNVEEATLPQLPVVTTQAATGITQTTATLNGLVNANGTVAMISFEFGTSTTYGQTFEATPDTVIGATDTPVKADINGLIANTKYHFRVKATCDNGTSYGTDTTFTTSEVALPVVTTAPITNITTTTATCGGNVTSDGGGTITARGVCWSADPWPTINDSHTTDGAGLGGFVSELTGLSPATVYYLRAYATNSAGTAYDNQVQFTTEVGQTPVVTTANITNISTISATGGGNVTDQGATPVAARGICWSTLANPTIAGIHTVNGSGTGGFTGDITGLLPATLYNVRAYATNAAGTVYGNQVQFTTSSTQMPTVTTEIIINITTTSATGGGNVTAQGTSPVTARGVCWSTLVNPTIAGVHTVNGSGNGNFTSDISPLLPSTVYYVRAYATNATGTSYGNQVQFTTNSLQAPVVTTSAITDITTTSASGGGNVTDQGTSPVTARGVCWSTLVNPTIAGVHSVNGSGIGNFTSEISPLVPATVYYARAYATNSAGTSYGNQVQFTTSAGTLPTVTTTSITNITYNSATGGGNVTAQGTTAVTSRGVCWSTTSNPTIANSHTTDGSGIGGFTSNISGLNPATTYFVRAYATNTAGTSYGSQVQFTTDAGSIPFVLTSGITNITTTSATGGGNVTSQGTTPVTARGVCWSTSTNPTIANSHTSNGTGAGSFTSNITGLMPATTYYVRAYATNTAGTGYGNQVQFTTSAGSYATVTTSSITDITTNTASGGGNVLNQGSTTVTARGVCWSTNNNPTIADEHTVNGSGAGIFFSNITGLLPSTTYYVRAYATNIAGTAYGTQVQFITTSLLPTVLTSGISDITTTTATGGGNVTAQGASEVTARGVCWNTTNNPNLADDHTSDGSGIGNFNSNLTELSPFTTYFVRAYATNLSGTAYGEEFSFTTLFICSIPITINHIAGDVAPVTKTVTYGTISNIPGEPTKCWITSNLGADHQATAVNDATEESAGWYWQFNRKQGYKHDGTTRTPSTVWINSIFENSDWLITNDPCNIELGDGWRIPTKAEWDNVDAGGNWTNWNGPWNSNLKMHVAGCLSGQDGSLEGRGQNGIYWTTLQDASWSAWNFYFDHLNSHTALYTDGKMAGYSIRCVKEMDK